MLNKVIQDALNDQIKNEFYSSYAYLAMSAYFEANNLPGFAHWMRLQSQEESGHAMRLFDFVHNRGGRVVLQPIDAPPGDFKSPLEVMQHALGHERGVSGMINKLHVLAVKESDFATQAEMQWFVTEQVEEEKNASLIVEQLRMVGDQGAVLFLLDRQLASRTPGAPAGP